MAIWNTKFESYINFFIENPIKTWWKCRRYFRFPNMSFHTFTHPMYNCPYGTFKWIGKIIDISIMDVKFKWKYDEIRFERSPYIWICFFGRFGFSINFHYYIKNEFNERELCDYIIWEYLLNYLYKYKSLSKRTPCLLRYSKIYKERDNEDKLVPSKYKIPLVQYSLTKKGIEQLKKELKNG